MIILRKKQFSEDNITTLDANTDWQTDITEREREPEIEYLHDFGEDYYDNPEDKYNISSGIDSDPVFSNPLSSENMIE